MNKYSDLINHFPVYSPANHNEIGFVSNTPGSPNLEKSVEHFKQLMERPQFENQNVRSNNIAASSDVVAHTNTYAGTEVAAGTEVVADDIHVDPDAIAKAKLIKALGESIVRLGSYQMSDSQSLMSKGYELYGAHA